MEAIDRAEEKIEQMSARAEAYQELSLEDGRESLDKKFKELEHESPDMDDELMALKQRALPDAQKKLPETTTAPEAPAEVAPVAAAVTPAATAEVAPVAAAALAQQPAPVAPALTLAQHLAAAGQGLQHNPFGIDVSKIGRAHV